MAAAGTSGRGVLVGPRHRLRNSTWGLAGGHLHRFSSRPSAGPSTSVCRAVGYGLPTRNRTDDLLLSSTSMDDLDLDWLGWRQDMDQVLNIGRPIGAGSFGQVRIGTYKASGQQVAVKFMSKIRGKLSKAETLRKIRSETDMLERVQGCPGAVRLYDCFEDERSVQLVMELCRGGDLKKYVEECGPLREDTLALVALEVLKFLKSCHDLHVVYADVKPANWCLVDQHPFPEDGLPVKGRRSSGYLRAIDMGSSQQIHGNERLIKRHGTLVYMAPEVFSSNYSYKADMWSVGITLYWLYSQTLPFWPNGPEPPMMRIDIMEDMARSLVLDFSSEPWTEMSEAGIDFISRCLKVPEDERMSSDEALRHPWILAAIDACSGNGACAMPISKGSCLHPQPGYAPASSTTTRGYTTMPMTVPMD